MPSKSPKWPVRIVHPLSFRVFAFSFCSQIASGGRTGGGSLQPQNLPRLPRTCHPIKRIPGKFEGELGTCFGTVFGIRRHPEQRGINQPKRAMPKPRNSHRRHMFSMVTIRLLCCVSNGISYENFSPLMSFIIVDTISMEVATLRPMISCFGNAVLSERSRWSRCKWSAPFATLDVHRSLEA